MPSFCAAAAIGPTGKPTIPNMWSMPWCLRLRAIKVAPSTSLMVFPPDARIMRTDRAAAKGAVLSDVPMCDTAGTVLRPFGREQDGDLSARRQKAGDSSVLLRGRERDDHRRCDARRAGQRPV